MKHYFVIYDWENGLWWNNEDGWTELYAATVFTELERNIFSLPIGGDWQMLPQIP